MRSDHKLDIVRPQIWDSQTANMVKSDLKDALSATERSEVTDLGTRGHRGPSENSRPSRLEGLED